MHSYCSASESKPWIRDKSDTHVAMTSGGSAKYVLEGVIKTPCDMDLTRYPFDSQTCEIKLASMAYR